MAKKIMTLDNLYQFFVEQNQTVNFTVKDTGKPIVVTTDGFFEENDSDTPGMQRLELKVCHTETNRNGSHISKSNMEKAMPTLKYRPVLAYIHELEDGTKDFYAHNMEIVENEDGESEIHYIEKQVGCFTAEDPWLKYDKKKDKTYVHAYAVIPEGYTEAADIIRRKGGTKVSCELVINELSYNAKEKYLDLTDFYFGGCTLLGVDEEGNEIGEGMLGARADIADFCHKEPIYTYQEKLIETLNKLNVTLESFSNTTKNSDEKGGEKVMNKFEELCSKYNKTAEEVTFEYENLSDEELEVAFKEAFEKTEEETETVVEETVVEENSEETVVEESAEEVIEETTEVVVDESVEEVVEPEKFTKTFTVELSHDDIRNALYTLIRQYENDDEYFYIREVFDSYFVMQDWWNNKIYKQSYAIDGENVSLNGDRIEVYEILVTKEEKDALDALKENYSALEAQYNELKAFKDNYDAAELKAKKDAIFAREEYSSIVETKAFKKLMEDSANYTLEECEQKANSILEDCNDYITNFAAKDNKTNKPKTLGLNFNAKPSKKKTAYGGLFDKDE
jgi:hypothetical protein